MYNYYELPFSAASVSRGNSRLHLWSNGNSYEIRNVYSLPTAGHVYTVSINE